jgi:uncharacterized membrane protein
VVAFIVFVAGVWIAWLTVQTAKRRGRSVTAWMWLGILFGPFAWLAVAMLPSIRKNGDDLTPNGPNGANPALPTGSAPAATAGKIATGRSRSLLLRPA